MLLTRSLRTGVLASLILAFSVLVAGTRPLEQTAASPPQIMPRRLVVIGDLHADLDAARRAFQLAGATDARDAWIGGPLVVVQMGDIIGRGREDRAVLEFVLALRGKAHAAGGTLHVLVGNHEVFGARPDYRWVDPAAFAAFESLKGLNLQDPRVLALPAPERARFAALMPGSAFAKQIAAFPAVLRIGDTVFAHAGVLPLWARYGIDRINTEVQAWFAGRGAEPRPTLGLDDGSADDGVMWSRHFAALPEPVVCTLADESLGILKANRMVVAHTVQKVITSRCDGRIWAVDVGISRYYGGDLQVLEILDGKDFRVIRE
jgi:Calcineurin-like phosphoesterase